MLRTIPVENCAQHGSSTVPAEFLKRPFIANIRAFPGTYEFWALVIFRVGFPLTTFAADSAQ